MMKKIIYGLLIIGLTINCESNSKKNNNSSEKKAGKETSISKDLLLLTYDEMRYDQTSLTAKVGQKITLTLKHLGKLDKSIMGHNFVLLKKDASVNKFINDAIAFASNDYIPTNSNDIIAYTKMLGGGESDTITFEILDKGEYTFLCSFPGHGPLMQGVLIVS